MSSDLGRSGREIKFPFSRGGKRAIYASFTTRVRRPEGAIKRFDASRFDWKGKACFFLVWTSLLKEGPRAGSILKIFATKNPKSLDN